MDLIRNFLLSFIQFYGSRSKFPPFFGLEPFLHMHYSKPELYLVQKNSERHNP